MLGGAPLGARPLGGLVPAAAAAPSDPPPSAPAVTGWTMLHVLRLRAARRLGLHPRQVSSIRR